MDWFVTGFSRDGRSMLKARRRLDPLVAEMTETEEVSQLDPLLRSLVCEAWRASILPLTVVFFSGAEPELPRQDLRSLSSGTLRGAIELAGFYFAMTTVKQADLDEVLDQVLPRSADSLEERLARSYGFAAGCGFERAALLAALARLPEGEAGRLNPRLCSSIAELIAGRDHPNPLISLHLVGALALAFPEFASQLAEAM